MRFGVVIPTKNRFHTIRQLLPPLSKAGFDEIIVVDSSDPCQREKVMEFCLSVGARYYFKKCNREEARNLGARLSTCDWIYFLNDDGSIPLKLYRDSFSRAAEGADFILNDSG
jgi:glycosyltransferase involved in cell wall biosynthesis